MLLYDFHILVNLSAKKALGLRIALAKYLNLEKYYLSLQLFIYVFARVAMLNFYFREFLLLPGHHRPLFISYVECHN